MFVVYICRNVWCGRYLFFLIDLLSTNKARETREGKWQGSGCIYILTNFLWITLNTNDYNTISLRTSILMIHDYSCLTVPVIDGPTPVQCMSSPRRWCTGSEILPNYIQLSCLLQHKHCLSTTSWLLSLSHVFDCRREYKIIQETACS